MGKTKPRHWWLGAVVLTVTLGVQCADAGTGWIMTSCRLTRRANEDPIVFPRQVGVSHLHQFFGNLFGGVSPAMATYFSMTSGLTTCQQNDRAGYWVPALWQDGVQVPPADDSRGIRIYYRRRVSLPVRSFPPDFRLVARQKYGREIYWGCSDNSTGKLTAPASCATGRITLHIGFPDCWNGLRRTGNEDTPNLAYGSSKGCPSTNPILLPRVIFRLEYPVGTTTGTITLGPMPDGMFLPASAAHGDFWNTWVQADLDRLVRDCLNADVDCGKL